MGKIIPKEEIKYVFNPGVLLPGDILLMNTYEERLRTKLNCKYEHAAIYIGDAYIMEANGLHVVMSHIYSYAFREKEHAYVLRLKNCGLRISEEIARKARTQMGRDYVDAKQFRYVRSLKNTDEKDTTNNSFCSRLVAQSYAQENIRIVHNPDFCEPDDFLNSEILEPVENAVVPFTRDLEKVVMFKQNNRIENEMESPNSEMFDSLSKVYNENIQDLGQVLIAAIRKPDCSDKAIEAIKASPMFKHNESVNKEMPWFWNDDALLAAFSDDEDVLHFVYSSLNHYDNTIIPDYRELHVQLITTAYYRPDCKVAAFLRDYIKTMVEEAIECRKRLEAIYEMMKNTRLDSFNAFVAKYGPYIGYKYIENPLDISFILHDLLKATLEDNQ